jgi:hypothetical protein
MHGNAEKSRLFRIAVRKSQRQNKAKSTHKLLNIIYLYRTDDGFLGAGQIIFNTETQRGINFASSRLCA